MIPSLFICVVVAAIAIVLFSFAPKKIPADLNDTARVRRQNAERKQRKLMRR
jgi:uncharacterized membrane protein